MVEVVFRSGSSAHPGPRGLVVRQAETTSEIAQARELFLEYEKALGISLCFQGFDDELAGLPGKYAPPSGRLLLCVYAGALAGCVALHGLDAEIGEMKRLYLRPAFRGKGLGQAMVDAIVAEARAIGYRRLRLDTIAPRMKNAVSLYRRMGFREIAPYCANPCQGALYMELEIG
jgi:ribosomal protein S18 acetylase RimI-like enzyme